MSHKALQSLEGSPGSQDQQRLCELWKSASRSFIKLLWLKQENVFSMFVPSQVSRCFLAEMTENIILILQCSDTNEKQNLPVDTVKRTVLMPPHSGFRSQHHAPSDFLCLHFLWGQCCAAWGSLVGIVALEPWGWDTVTLQLPDREPPANPCTSARATDFCVPN